MLNKNYFENPNLWLENHNKNKLLGFRQTGIPSMPDELFKACPSCREPSLAVGLENNLDVCLHCGFHFMIGARRRINMLVDEGSFIEKFSDIESINIIDFPGYDEKLEVAKKASGENEAVICGEGKICGHSTMLCVMDSSFIMGSMGIVVGEKITLTFEEATKRKMPVVVFTVSGGARMQEGVFSLMQMAKTSGAVKRHSDKGLLYLCVITNPTTGGVTASFAMEGDIIISEPQALICFAGPRVIEQTIGQKLPEGFQLAEFLLEKGFLDAIVPRKELKSYIAKILKFHLSMEGNTK